MRLTLWLPNRSHRWPAIHNGSEAIFLDGHRFVCWQVPTPQFYPNSVRPLNMNLWMPRQERPIVVGQGRNSNRDDSRRRGQPRAFAGSVSADVNRRLGLARRRVADRIPGVPPRSAAHPWLCTDGLPGRRSAPANSKAFRITVDCCRSQESYGFLNQPAITTLAAASRDLLLNGTLPRLPQDRPPRRLPLGRRFLRVQPY